MEIRQLRYFLAVAEELNIGRAAARLDIAQPSLSRQIGQLEETLRVELFDRSRSQIRLTQAGEVLLQHGERLIEQLDEALHETRLVGSGSAGRLRLGFTDCASFGHLPAIVRAFRHARPDVNLVLIPLSPSPLKRALVRGEIDIAVSRQPLEDESFHTEVLARESLVVAVPEHWTVGLDGRLALADLSEVALIVCGSGVQDGMDLALCLGAGLEPTEVITASDTRFALGLVSMGAGVALVSAALECIAPADVRLVAFSDRNPGVKLTIGTRIDNRSAQVRTFFALAHQIASDLAELEPIPQVQRLA